MATFADIFQRSSFMAPGQAMASGAEANCNAGPAMPDPYRLREIPCSEIYIHTKHIDNSRVIRESDPHSGVECWKTIGASAAIVAMLITVAAPSVYSTIAGYRVHALEQEEQRLTDERKVLEVELAHEQNPVHLDELARQKNLKAPAAGQVVRLDAQSSEALASVFSNKR